jgi:hypothetical protein
MAIAARFDLECCLYGAVHAFISNVWFQEDVVTKMHIIRETEQFSCWTRRYNVRRRPGDWKHLRSLLYATLITRPDIAFAASGTRAPWRRSLSSSTLEEDRSLAEMITFKLQASRDSSFADNSIDRRSSGGVPYIKRWSYSAEEWLGGERTNK